jgi:hypothetical protein
MTIERQIFLLLHLAVGVMFVHAFAGGLYTFLRPTASRFARNVQVLSTAGMAGMAWIAVISGTWLVYPGYRAVPPAGAQDLAAYPKAWLVANPSMAWWHEFGMEWKEHVGWISAFVATGVAAAVLLRGDLVRTDKSVRRWLSGFFAVAFVASVVASALGAAINKVSPNDFLFL